MLRDVLTLSYVMKENMSPHAKFILRCPKPNRNFKCYDSFSFKFVLVGLIS